MIINLSSVTKKILQRKYSTLLKWLSRIFRKITRCDLLAASNFLSFRAFFICGIFFRSSFHHLLFQAEGKILLLYIKKYIIILCRSYFIMTFITSDENTGAPTWHIHNFIIYLYCDGKKVMKIITFLKSPAVIIYFSLLEYSDVIVFLWGSVISAGFCRNYVDLILWYWFRSFVDKGLGVL